MTLIEWADKYNITSDAFKALLALNIPESNIPPDMGISEQAVKAFVRLEAANKGIHLWVNNSGAFKDSRGVQVRYGLGNISKEVNARFKSSDLIGIRPVIITSAHVGDVIGQFVARECKKVDWKYRGGEHELAQLNFLNLITYAGGDAMFCNGSGSL